MCYSIASHVIIRNMRCCLSRGQWLKHVDCGGARGPVPNLRVVGAAWVPLVPPCWPTQGVGVWGMVPHHPRGARVWAIVLAWRLYKTFMFGFKRNIHIMSIKFSFVKYMLRSTWTELDLLSLLLPWPVDGQPWWGAVCTYNNNPKLTLCELWNVIVGIY